MGIQLSKIRFENYKRFSDREEIELRPVTLLIGKNSSGKSSITRLFPMIGKSLSGDLESMPISFVNDNVSLGTSFQSLCHNGNMVELKFGVSFVDETSIDIELMSLNNGDVIVNKYKLQTKKGLFTLHRESGAYKCVETGKLYSDNFNGFVHVELFKDIQLTSSYTQTIDYIGPLRVNPERFLTYNGNEKKTNVGARGENAYPMYCADAKLQSAVSTWFENSFNECKVRLKSTPEAGISQIVFSKKDQEPYEVNIADEGMGIGQVFPIIVRCLRSIYESIVVIEQPELHLHPAAHASLAKLFAETAIANKQTYVIETHSENLLLGLRKAVVDKSVSFSPEDIVIYFIKEDESGAFLEKITIDESGALSDWPKGVFNESFELMRSILQKSQA